MASVIGGTFLRVAKYRVGFVYFPKPLCSQMSQGVANVTVWVQFHSQLAVGLFDFFICRCSGDAQH